MKEPDYVDCLYCGEYDCNYCCCMLLFFDRAAVCPYSFGVLCSEVVKREKDFPFDPDFYLKD